MVITYSCLVFPCNVSDLLVHFFNCTLVVCIIIFLTKKRIIWSVMFLLFLILRVALNASYGNKDIRWCAESYFKNSM